MDDLLINCKKIAQRVFKREGLIVPVDIKKLVLKYSDLEECHIPFYGDAICINNADRPLIIYMTDSIETRLRFTLAHELGHIKIAWHTGMILCHTDDENSINQNEYEYMERQANVFASELLMPTFWLVNIVTKYEEQGLEILINKISSLANVSFLAVIYAIIKVLPEEYVIFIHNHAENYIQKLMLNHNKMFFIYDHGSYCKKWVEINSTKFDLIRRDNETIRWYKLESNLTEDDINRLLLMDNNKIDLTRVFHNIFDIDGNSPAIILNSICGKLPAGYIIKVALSNSEICGYMRSNNTFIQPQISKHKSTDEWYDSNSINKGVYYNTKYIISWWQFKIFTEIKCKVADIRDSKTILKNIIDGNYHDDNRSSIFGSINGIFGALNNKRDKINSNEFYSILRQKFLGREDLKDIIDDKDFDKFLVKKTQELYSK